MPVHGKRASIKGTSSREDAWSLLVCAFIVGDSSRPSGGAVVDESEGWRERQRAGVRRSRESISDISSLSLSLSVWDDGVYSRSNRSGG